MCCYVFENLWIACLRRGWIGDDFWGGLSDSLRGSAVRTCLHSVGDSKAARIANLSSSSILVLETHSLVLFPSATVEQVFHLESYVAL